MNKKLVNLIFGISLSVLLLLSVLTFDRLSTFKEYSDIIDRSNQTLLAISNLKSGFNTAIAEQRSYLLTKDTTYYYQFQEEKNYMRHSLQQFSRLTREDKVHQYYAEKLEEQVDNRIQSLLVEVINDTSSAKYKYVQNELIFKNEQINRDFYELINKVDQHEKLLLKRRLRLKEFEEQFTPFLLFILTLATLGFLGYSFVLVSRELQKRDEATELLQENVENLNRSNKELEQYAYVASHDLQEPLRKIRMFATKLTRDHSENLDEKGLNLLQRMDASSERMTNLINDLLSLSRLLSDEPEKENVKLQLVVNEVLQSFEDKTEDVEIDLGELPEISGHKGQIYQLFQNLIGNAIKFRRNDVNSFIRVKAYKKVRYKGDIPSMYHHIVVKDNGKGFDRQFKDKMFTVFGRLEKTSDVEGTGIGLSICSRIMQNHGGEIDADGEVNEGAEFHLYFPA
ncbi:ATP-binding protein [Jiulongibacter sediminis]|jgi:signal transduction histidine kinase|uniref:ATP-binding protein n=1 Tax=Jiulongibacter sediminis TaxID=1605367 RepID=UPI0026F124EE|nr:ATP-binding protein [Jiulongibacter sediminis]